VSRLDLRVTDGNRADNATLDNMSDKTRYIYIYIYDDQKIRAFSSEPESTDECWQTRRRNVMGISYDEVSFRAKQCV